MKDEELAEEYLQSIEGDDCVIITDREERKQAFLAGLKASKSQWHDLREDPNDLPKNKRNVWCDYSDDYGKGFYDKDEGRWVIEGHLYCSIIVAWCELPTFDKE